MPGNGDFMLSLSLLEGANLQSTLPRSQAPVKAGLQGSEL
jgi:hypothetical protein